MNVPKDDANKQIREIIRSSASDSASTALRTETAAFAAKTFVEVGNDIHLSGHLLGTDRRDGKSPFGHGSDEAVGVSVLLRIGGQLVSASADLLTQGRPYAGAALLRQVVEVEYLAWAFETRDGDAERWLRSDRDIREDFFRPAKLRSSAQGRFRSQDYGYHCEFGGHPVPTAGILLSDDIETPQLFLSDLIGHTGRIWDHLVRWAHRTEPHGRFILSKSDAVLERFQAWKRSDALAHLPAPPQQ